MDIFYFQMKRPTKAPKKQTPPKTDADALIDMSRGVLSGPDGSAMRCA